MHLTCLQIVYWLLIKIFFEVIIQQRNQMNEIDTFLTQSTDPETIFQLMDILGQGAYGSVSKAIHKQTGQRYAVKILPATNLQQLTSIKKQISILRECDDQHIVKYFGCYLKDNNLWIIMQYCDAGSITDIMHITDKSLNEYQIASILESVLRGLLYLHSKKKIHRDIKAANILLNQQGDAKLADFGVSTESRFTNDRHKTHIGSPYWMSPQVLKMSEYTHKTDIWSLGITAIELAEGTVPYSDVKPYRAMWKMREKPTQTLTQPSNWSKEFNKFVERCLQLDPSKRPEARQLLEDPFIVQKSRGKRLLAQLAFNCLQEIQEFRRGSQSNNSSFAEGIIIQGGSIRNLTVRNHSENHDSLMATQRDPIENSFIVKQDQQLNGSMIINETSMDEAKNPLSKIQGSHYLSHYISELKQINNVESQRKEILIKALESADVDCVDELYVIYQKWRSKVLQNLKELENINLTFSNNSQNGETLSDSIKLAKSCQFNEFLRMAVLKQDTKSKSQQSKDHSEKQNQPQKLHVQKIVITKNASAQVDRSLSQRRQQNTTTKNKSAQKVSQVKINPFAKQTKPKESMVNGGVNIHKFVFNQQKERISVKTEQHRPPSLRNQQKLQRYEFQQNYNLKQFMDDPTVLSFLRRNSNPSNQVPLIAVNLADANKYQNDNTGFNLKHEQKSDVLINRRNMQPFIHNQSKLVTNVSKNLRDRESCNVNSNIHNMTKIKAKQKQIQQKIEAPSKNHKTGVINKKNRQIVYTQPSTGGTKSKQKASVNKLKKNKQH